MNLLSPREAYRRWAPSYGGETAVSHLDELLVARLTPPLAGRTLLDVGCGTGRRLRSVDALEALGIEPCAEMLAAGADDGPWPRHVRLLRGDVRALPIAVEFDVVWSRLVLGHVAELRQAYAELARVTAPRGRLVVTDFHPRAVEVGHRRTFRDAEGVHAIEHHVHTLDAHGAAAAATGLDIVEVREGRIGPEVRRFYVEAGKLALYEIEADLPIVLALAFEKSE